MFFVEFAFHGLSHGFLNAVQRIHDTSSFLAYHYIETRREWVEPGLRKFEMPQFAAWQKFTKPRNRPLDKKKPIYYIGHVTAKALWAPARGVFFLARNEGYEKAN
jgi:hypothetical protein